MGHPLPFCIVEEHLRPRMERRAVEEQERRAPGEAGGEPVPHHPAEGGEVEEPVARAHVGVQPELLEVLQEHAGAMHDAFRRAGGAGGVEDDDAGDRRAAARSAAPPPDAGRVKPSQVTPFESAAAAARPSPSWPTTTQCADGRQERLQLGELARELDALAGVAVAVGGEEQLRRDLAEAVEHAAHPEIRRGRGPDRPERDGGEHGGHRLGHVRQEPRHPVARADPGGGERLLQPRDLGAQLGPRTSAGPDRPRRGRRSHRSPRRGRRRRRAGSRRSSAAPRGRTARPASARRRRGRARPSRPPRRRSPRSRPRTPPGRRATSDAAPACRPSGRPARSGGEAAEPRHRRLGHALGRRRPKRGRCGHDGLAHRTSPSKAASRARRRRRRIVPRRSAAGKRGTWGPPSPAYRGSVTAARVTAARPTISAAEKPAAIS